MWYKKKYLRQKENLDYMFRALESDDYAFKFIDDGSDFNENLNKVKELLTRAKLRAIEREKNGNINIDASYNEKEYVIISFPIMEI